MLLCVLLALQAVPGVALAEEPLWALGWPDAQPGDEATAQTFHELLRDKLRARRHVRLVELTGICPDVECVREAARPRGAEVAVYVSLRRLGQKIIATLTTVNVQSGATEFSDSMGTQTVEELDVVAERLVEALVEGGAASDNAVLGQITDEEERAPRRRDVRVAAVLGLNAIVPFEGYADRLFGGGFEAGVWVEGMHFAISTTLGLRADLSSSDNRYIHVPFEVQGAYLFSLGDVSPLIGLGVGINYLREDVYVTHRVGNVLVSETHDRITDSIAAFSGTARVGLLLMRTYDVSLLVAVDYLITAGAFEERSVEHALRIVFDTVLGGT